MLRCLWITVAVFAFSSSVVMAQSVRVTGEIVQYEWQIRESKQDTPIFLGTRAGVVILCVADQHYQKQVEFSISRASDSARVRVLGGPNNPMCLAERVESIVVKLGQGGVKGTLTHAVSLP